MVDSCPSYGTENEVYEMLMHNFRRHYESNRAPLGLYFHTIWFKKKINLRGFQVTNPSVHYNWYWWWIFFFSAIPRRNDSSSGSVGGQQLGSHSMDAETDAHHSTGPVRAVEVQNSGGARGPGVQHRQILQVTGTRAQRRSLPAHLQRLPRCLSLDQERIRPRYLIHSLRSPKTKCRPLVVQHDPLRSHYYYY